MKQKLLIGLLSFSIGSGVLAQQGFRPGGYNSPINPNYGGMVIPKPDGSRLYQTPDLGGHRIQYHSPHVDPRNGLHRNIRVYNQGRPIFNAHLPVQAFPTRSPVTIPLVNPIVMDQMYKGLYQMTPEPLRGGMSPSLFQQNGVW